MSRELEKLREEVSSQGRELDKLTDKMRDIEETEKIKQMLKDQEKGTFKYLLDTLKVIAAIVLLLTAGNKVTDTPQMNKEKVKWIESLVR